jgi:uncharacterized protein YjiS (DUF1127 family)
MSTTNAIAVRSSYVQRMLATAHGLLEASLIAWRTRREHRNAIAQLRTMSDAELRDVGVERESIEPAVMYGRHYDIRRPIDVI